MAAEEKDRDRILITRITSRWGIPAYHLSVDGEAVGVYRYLADARKVGKARIAYLAETDKQLDDDLMTEFDVQ